MYSAENAEPAWVSDGDTPAALWWVDRKTGKPIEPIGVDRECDVPGIHTPSAAAQIQAMPLEKQRSREWPPS